MTPKFWHEKSIIISQHKWRIGIVALLSLALGIGIDVVGSYIVLSSKFWLFLKITAGFAFFVCFSLIGVRIYFTGKPAKLESYNIFKMSWQQSGVASEWVFSILLTVWYLGVLVVFVLAIYENVFS